MTIAEKLTAIAENEKKVYEAGKQAEHDRFWDAYQEKGERVVYGGAFFGAGWTVNTFKPKYSIKPTNAYRMFAESNIPIDLAACLDAIGIELDFSKCTNIGTLFQLSAFTRVGEIVATNTTALANTFSDATNLKTIDKLILRSTGSNTFSGTFSNASALENITIEGVIGNNIDFSACTKLTHDSLMSIINHLQQKTSGSFVLTLGADNLAKLTDEEKAIATERGWTLA